MLVERAIRESPLPIKIIRLIMYTLILFVGDGLDRPVYEKVTNSVGRAQAARPTFSLFTFTYYFSPPTTRSLSRSDNLTRKAETRVDFAFLPTKKLENASSQKIYNLCIAHKNQPKKPSDKIFVKIPQSLVIQWFIGFFAFPRNS